MEIAVRNECGSKRVFHVGDLMIRRISRLTLSILLCGAMAVPVLAQKKNKDDQSVRTVQGTVTDPGGSGVDGAVVQLKNTRTLQIRSFITKNNGGYFFHGLSPDVDYELKADFRGSSSGTKTLSSFDTRRQAVINLKLNK